MLGTQHVLFSLCKPMRLGLCELGTVPFSSNQTEMLAEGHLCPSSGSSWALKPGPCASSSGSPRHPPAGEPLPVWSWGGTLLPSVRYSSADTAAVAAIPSCWFQALSAQTTCLSSKTPSLPELAPSSSLQASGIPTVLPSYHPLSMPSVCLISVWIQ